MKTTTPNQTSMMTAAFAKVAALVVAANLLATLTGCSGSSGAGGMAAAINETIHEKVAFSVEDKKVPTWPLRVRRPLGLMEAKPLDPILAAMQAAGYLKVTQERVMEGFQPTLVDVISPT